MKNVKKIETNQIRKLLIHEEYEKYNKYKKYYGENDWEDEKDHLKRSIIDQDNEKKYFSKRQI